MDKLINGSRSLGLELSNSQLEQFELYFQLLKEWNKKTNLTRIVGYQEVQIKHFLDSLSVLAAQLPNPPDGLKLLDVGTGAGFPGVPLRIVCPSMSLYLLDSIGKKTAFLGHLTQTLGLCDVNILTGRAENLARYKELRETFDVVVSRAVAPVSVLSELTLPFCKLGGVVVLQKNASYISESGDAFNAIKMLGGRFEREVQVDLSGLSIDRRLVVVSKIDYTPNRYPRKAGTPGKRPL